MKNPLDNELRYTENCIANLVLVCEALQILHTNLKYFNQANVV